MFQRSCYQSTEIRSFHRLISSHQISLKQSEYMCNTPIFYIVIYSKIFQLALPSINGKVCDVINISRCLLWNTHPHVWCTCNTYIPLPLNVLAFISSSAAEIYEIHILVISLSIRTTVAIVLFCFYVRLTFSVPQVEETSMKKKVAINMSMSMSCKAHFLYYILWLLIMSMCDEYIINLSAS